MKPQIMIDLEFLGKIPTAAIASIGAVQFDLTGIKREIYIPVDLRTSVKMGGTLDADTVLFWLEQSAPARAAITDPNAIHIAEALLNFSLWMPKGSEVWGNGSDCDNPILIHAYDGCTQQVPWDRIRGNRCYRTMKNMYPDVAKPPVNNGLHHALANAKWQALYLIKIMKYKRNLEELGRSQA
jgi:exodeoxyribonuclease VIII